MFCPSIADDPEARESFARHERLSASPGSATTYLRATSHIDVRYALPTVTAPTLVLNASREKVTPIAWSRYMVERLPDAKLVELDSADHLLWYSDVLDTITEEVESFLTGAVPRHEVNRVLATVLIVDLGTATKSGAEHCADVIDRFRGTVVEHGSAEIVATFDGPARAVRCASTIVQELCAQHRYSRVGLHSGECDVAGAHVGGVAVDIARQVMSLARPGEVLASQTVRDVVLGSGLVFSGPMCHVLDGIEGEWRVYSITETD
jgi:class 3 adenylate cyclase